MIGAITSHHIHHTYTHHHTTPQSQQTYPTSQFAAFDDAMEAFLESNELKGVKPRAAALAVAGAVENNRCPMTNISWVIDGEQIGKRFGFA